jgi:hypothetical protein
LTRKDVVFTWQHDQQVAFDRIKDAFTKAPLLAHFDPSKQCLVETNASDFAIGMILSQRQADESIQPAAFLFTYVPARKINYETHDKELLAIVVAFMQWRHFLEGSPHQIKVQSDHANLQAFSSSRILNRRQARWSMILSEFDYVIHHRPGSLSGKPDALSRRAEYEIECHDPFWQQQKTSVIRPEQLSPDAVTLFSTTAESVNRSLEDYMQSIFSSR